MCDSNTGVSILQFKCLKYPSSSGADQENLISGGRDTFYFTESFFFDIIGNITEKGGEGAAAVPPGHTPTLPPSILFKE